MTGKSSPRGHKMPGVTPRKIVVTGPCGYEVDGVMSLLSGAGYPVCRARAVTADAQDMVVVALSACPEPGWWKHQEQLRRLRRAGHYRMVALVPGSLERVVSRQGICPVVAGDVPVPLLWRNLLAEVRVWHDGRPPREMPGGVILSVQQERALAELLSGRVVRRKVQYSHRYLGLARLGFYSSLQYQRYYSGGLLA